MRATTLAIAAALATVTYTANACNTCGCTPAEETTTDTSAPHAGGDHMHDIVDTAVETEGFATLVAAVKAADLVGTLKGEGPFTVFAPNDAAFAKVPADTLNSLLEPAGLDQLTSILTFHVVPGKVMAADVVGLTEADTVNGKKLDISVDGGTVTVSGAKVIATDVECTNGVIHVIDTVMMP